MAPIHSRTPERAARGAAARSRTAAILLLAVSLLALRAGGAEETAALKPGLWMLDDGSSGMYDLLEFDPAAHRLLASHWEDGTADFFDVDAFSLLAQVHVGPAVDVTVDSKTGDYWASIQVDARIAVIDGHLLKEKASIPMPGKTDALLLDAGARRLYVAESEGPSLWVIDLDSMRRLATIPIPGVPGCMARDPVSGRIYLNLKDKGAVAVIDPSQGAVISTWTALPARQTRGLALDPGRGRVYSAGGNGQLVEIDGRTGKVVSSVAIGLEVEQIAIDVKLNRIYCAGPNAMTVVATAGPRLENLGSVSTVATAINVAIDPGNHSVWMTFTDGEDGFAKQWLQPDAE